MIEVFITAVAETSFAGVDIIIIILMKIIADINIIPPVIVKICYSKPKSKTKFTLTDPGLFRNINEFARNIDIISEKIIACICIKFLRYEVSMIVALCLSDWFRIKQSRSPSRS